MRRERRDDRPDPDRCLRGPGLTPGHDRAIAREALELELEAVARYVAHAAATSDPRLVSYWESLRRNEAEHRDLLRAWLRDAGDDEGGVREGAGTGSGAQAPPPGSAAPPAESLPPGDAASPAQSGQAASVPGFARDLAALEADREFEIAAVRRYGQMANEACNPGLKELLKELLRGEAGHRRGLRRTIAAVTDPARPVILFCPLCGWEIDFGPSPAEGTQGKCRMCPGRFALRLDAHGDWTLERLAP